MGGSVRNLPRSLVPLHLHHDISRRLRALLNVGSAWFLVNRVAHHLCLEARQFEAGFVMADVSLTRTAPAPPSSSNSPPSYSLGVLGLPGYVHETKL
jgi:hypothetical protein